MSTGSPASHLLATSFDEPNVAIVRRGRICIIGATWTDHRPMLFERFAPIVIIVVVGGQSNSARACDDLIDRLVRAKAEPAFANIDCGALGKAGVDKQEHELKRVCYTSTGPTSRLEVEASVTCKTGNSLLHVSLTGKATATAEIRGADCQIVSFDLQPSGDLAHAINGVFGIKGKLKDALQKALDQTCR